MICYHMNKVAKQQKETPVSVVIPSYIDFFSHYVTTKEVVK